MYEQEHHYSSSPSASFTRESATSSPADLVREIEALRARTLALQRKIDSTATGMNQQQLLEERRQNAEQVKKIDRELTDAHHKEKEIKQHEQHAVNETLRRTWSQQRATALERFRERRKEIHDSVAEENRQIQELARKRIDEETARRQEVANQIRRASKRSVTEQREHVVDEARRKNREEAELTKSKLSQYQQDLAQDLEETKRRKQHAKKVREALAAAAKAKIEKQRHEFHQKELDLRSNLAQVREKEEERRRAVSERAKRRREENEQRRADADRRVKAQRQEEALRIRKQLAEEVQLAKDARDQEIKARAFWAHEQEKATLETIKQVRSSERVVRSESASGMRRTLKEASQRRAQSDSARTAARSRRRVEEASASRDRFKIENAQKLHQIVQDGKDERSHVSQEVQRRRELEAQRKKRRAELVRKEESKAHEEIRKARHHDPHDETSVIAEVHESRRQWEEEKRKRDEHRRLLQQEVNKRRQQEKEAQEKLKQEMMADIETQRTEKKQDRAKLMETLLERKRIMEAQLARVEEAVQQSMSRSRVRPQ